MRRSKGRFDILRGCAPRLPTSERGLVYFARMPDESISFGWTRDIAPLFAESKLSIELLACVPGYRENCSGLSSLFDADWRRGPSEQFKTPCYRPSERLLRYIGALGFVTEEQTTFWAPVEMKEKSTALLAAIQRTFDLFARDRESALRLHQLDWEARQEALAKKPTIAPKRKRSTGDR